MNDCRLPLTCFLLVTLSLCADALGPRGADKKQPLWVKQEQSCKRLRSGPAVTFACFCRQRLRLRGGGGRGNGKLDGKRRNMYGTERTWKGPKPWVKNEQPRTIDIHKAKLDKRAAKMARTSRENVLKKRMTERARHFRRDFRKEQSGGDQVIAVHANSPRESAATPGARRRPGRGQGGRQKWPPTGPKGRRYHKKRSDCPKRPSSYIFRKCSQSFVSARLQPLPKNLGRRLFSAILTTSWGAF